MTYRFERVNFDQEKGKDTLTRINAEVAKRHRDGWDLLSMDVVGPDEHDKWHDVYLHFRKEEEAA